MYTLRLIIFCACYCSYGNARNSVSHVSKLDPKWRNWWDAVRATPTYRPHSRTEKIGEGIKLHAKALYDSNFLNSTNSTVFESKNESTVKYDGMRKDKLEEYFRALFEEVPQYFNNQSIMINITVENVTLNDDLVAYYPDQKDIINASETLKNVTKYGESQGASNDTAFYLFTWPSAKGNTKTVFDYIVKPPNHRLGV
ncbi:uncharacterized protein [Dermacentor albipictus]|uniref:uncharacterized protein n=1 Tax=Dermacentor albipictus TaxID=60249 RepID=UPI0031FDE2A0